MPEPELLIFRDPESLSRAAAEQFAAIAAEAAAARGRFTVALAGGGTPQTLYRLLARPPYLARLPWPRTHVFWGDERSVPPDHPGSNYRQARLALLDHVPIPPGHVHRIKGELEPAAAARDYARLLRGLADAGLAWPRFDLALLGMGTDGHTASLFPGPISPAERESPALAVTARYQGRPAQRVTLTPLALNAARNVVFLVVGESKAEALAAVLNGSRDLERWPVQRIRPAQGVVTWLVDEPAAGRLAGPAGGSEGGDSQP